MTPPGRGGLRALIVGLAVMTALVVGGFFVLMIVSLNDLSHQRAQDRAVSNQLDTALIAQRDLVGTDAAARDFLLNGKPEYMAAYERGRQAVPAELRTLRRTAVGTVERSRSDRLDTLATAYLRDYAPAAIAAPSTLSPGRRAALSQEGGRRMAALGGLFSGLIHELTAARARARGTVDETSNETLVIAGIGLGVTLLLMLTREAIILRLVLRPVRTVASAADRLAGGDLTTRVPLVGLGEVAQLGRAFNDMAGSLEGRSAELIDARAQLREALSDAEAEAQVKSTFLANMSHEIRTPLNGVVGMLDLLAQTSVSPEQSGYVDVARASGEALMIVVNDVLDLAKIEAGRLELERLDFDVRDVVEVTCDMVAATAATKRLELQSFVHADVPRSVSGDRARVGQILANLLSNAVKFTTTGEVVIEVTVAGHEEGKTLLRFEVSDTGIGIAADRIKWLFEAFTQADTSTTREFGGTGLGLTISLELTNLMGGALEVESELGQGSTFRFQIPFTAAEAEAPAPVAAISLDGLRVLVVDDNATNRRVFEAYAQSWGMRPAVAEDAAAAMIELDRGASEGDPFDVALIDLNMPGENGIQLAGRIRDSNRLPRTRLILLTSSASGRSGDPVDLFSGRLTKPVRQSRLHDAITAAMASQAGAVQPEPRPTVTSTPSMVPRAPAIPSPLRILVAEDQAVNWMLIERMLAKRGYRAANAPDGEKLLEMHDAGGRWDLIFMDCQMPVLDGYATTREIRRREALSGERVPVVAMTANAMAGDRQRCLEAGMDDYMAKPISGAAVGEMLDQWLPDPATAGPAVDRSRLAELGSLFTPAELTRMLQDLSRAMTEDMTRLRDAAVSGDPAGLADAAHRIKSGAQMVGASDVTSAASELESRGRDGQANGRTEADVTALAAHWHAAQMLIAAETVSLKD